MLYTSYKPCPIRQNGTNASNVKNIFFIIIGFYRLPPDLTPPPVLPLLLPAEPELKLPVLLEELLLGLLTLELLLLEEELLGLVVVLPLLLEEELLGLLTLVFLLEEELELGLTYSELERT